MSNNSLHLSDQQLLLMADGELSSDDAGKAHLHLAACLECRARMAKIERTIADFTQLHDDAIVDDSASASQSRALLKARLAQLSATTSRHTWQQMLRPVFAGRVGAGIAAVVLLAAVGIVGTHRQSSFPNFETMFARAKDSPVPNRLLTPGATRPVKISDVCTERHFENPPMVPISVQQKIFREYGMPNARPMDYELDYLVTPELGGSDDPRNLWPQPHADTLWNSYVKDDLEDRLHQMVCDGSLDLVTAQQDIATDWIAAYKKYFQTDKPAPTHSGMALISRQGPNI